jgi:D-alanyl-D-alanine dipeptidase
MVQQAAVALPKGMFLTVTDAWRPFQRQRLIYEFMTRSAREAFPTRSEFALKRTVNRWVAPPNRKAPPGHCTGAALDVILQNETGDQIDVTSPFDRMGGGPTFVYGLTPEAEANRMVLYDAMMGAGFSNCRDEWWHYSFGDAGWAVRLDQPNAIYGLAELPQDLYRDQQEKWEVMHKERPNPFL